MAAFHRAGEERANAFEVDDAYLFKHYFEDDGVFAELGRYYDDYEYRFEVPTDRFEHVRDFLERHGYAIVVVDDPTPYVVVKRKYTNHPSVLFREAVLHRSVGNFNCFLMADKDAADRAVAEGATPLAESGVSFTL